MGSDFYLCYFVENNVFEKSGEKTTPNICLEIKVMTTLQSQPQCQTPAKQFFGGRERNTRRFSQGAIIAFLWFSLSQTKVFGSEKSLTAFDIPKGFVAFLELQFTFVTFLHDERHLALGHFALVHLENSFGRGTKYSFIIWSENWLRDEPTYPAL